jgi:hypothetical protein
MAQPPSKKQPGTVVPAQKIDGATFAAVGHDAALKAELNALILKTDKLLAKAAKK